MILERIKNSGEIAIGIAIATFVAAGVMHGFDHAFRMEVILAILALSVVFVGIHLLTPRRLMEGREKAARLGQAYKLNPAEAVFMAAGLFVFGLAIYALGMI
ncbi:hypothetical protein [Devosia sp. CAU 1758]